MRINLFILLLFVAFDFVSQNNNFNEKDTINIIDATGKKQGHWIVWGKSKPETCYRPDQKVEEGFYKDNKKIGIWTEYYCKGNIKDQITFVDGRPKGYYKSYYENGCLLEQGIFIINKWVGDYKLYYDKKDTCGKLKQHFVFDEKGKRTYAKYYSPNGNEVQERTDSTFIIIPNYTKQDSLRLESCSCDSVIVTGQKKYRAPGNEYPEVKWTDEGYLRLYRKDKQLSKCGYLYEYKLIYGFVYRYDENNKLIKIEKYFNGKYTGDCK